MRLVICLEWSDLKFLMEIVKIKNKKAFKA
jgi:hypothetical protein